MKFSQYGGRNSSSSSLEWNSSGVCGETSTTNDLKRSQGFFLAAIIYLCLVFIRSPDVDGCIIYIPRGKSSKILIMITNGGSSLMMLILSASIQPRESCQKEINFSLLPAISIRKICRKQQLLTAEQDAHAMGNVHGVSKTLYSIKRALQFVKSYWEDRGKRLVGFDFLR